MHLRAVVFVAMLFSFGCAQEKVSDPVLAYKAGKLHFCDGSSKIERRPSDIVTLLDNNEVAAMNEWVKKQFESAKDVPLSDEILFVHVLPQEGYAPDALFSYYHLRNDPNTGYCEVDGRINGTTPFNEQLLEKYGKKNPS